MKAIIIATSEPKAVEVAGQPYLAGMLPLLDRPMLQHVVEFLASHGITEIDFVLSLLPEKVESWFGDGSRWGVTARYHLAQCADRPYRTLKAIMPRESSEPILLLHGDRLPVDERMCQAPESNAPMPRTFAWHDQDGAEPNYLPRATGWLWIMPSFVDAIPGEVDVDQFYDFCIEKARRNGELVDVGRPLSAHTYSELIESHRRVLSGKESSLLVAGREVEPGVWIGRDVSMPSTVKVVPPVYLGPHCRIGTGATLGPNACLGEGSVLESHCTVENSLVLPGSYIGESLEVQDLIVDRNRVINTRLGVDCPVSEDFIIGSMQSRPFHNGLLRLFGRAAALTLLAVGWPILLLVAIGRKISGADPVLYKTEYVHLPALANPATWTTCRQWSFTTERNKSGFVGHFLFEFLPALVNIAFGSLHFVGGRPRDATELEQLPEDWRELVLRTKPGVITEAFIRFGPKPTSDEMYSAEAFYAVRSGFRHDFRLVTEWLVRVIRGRVTTSCPKSHVARANRSGTVDHTMHESGSLHPAELRSSLTATLTTNSSTDSLDPMRQWVCRVCRDEFQLSIDEQRMCEILTAVQEVATNLMRHAYHGSAEGSIQLDIKADSERLTIQMLHHGTGFDPEGVDDSPLDAPREGGLGLYIIRQYVDEVKYFDVDEDTHGVSLTINLIGEPIYANDN